MVEEERYGGNGSEGETEECVLHSGWKLLYERWW